MPDKSIPAVLLLADGTVAHGKAFGAIGTTTGEICFNTGMTGYQEVFTDPSYFGQILIMNSAHIGNYGVKEADVESDSVKINGLIGRNLEDQYSRKMANGSMNDYLKANKIVSIEGVDTRALVAHVRTKGAMNCIISSETTDIELLKKKLAETPNMDGLELASKVSTSEAYELGDTNSAIRIAVMDYGVKRNILNCMVERGAYEEKPVFGICLGHQLLALANDIPTFKMHHGHRGLNHPVKNIISGRSEITTQNHGFGVDPEAVKKADHIEITHINLNDQSIEGIRVKGKPAFSVQYHPEATPGPHDSRYLFDEFIKMIEDNKN
jgi:carbamoyl-phosphate synthase small subunit